MKEVSTFQITLMFMITTIASKVIMLPALIAQVAMNDLCWVFLFNFLIDGVFFLIFLFILKSNPNLTFRQLIEKSLGKVVSKIIFFLLAGYFIIKAIVVAEEAYVLFDETVYVLMDKYLFTFVLLLLVSYASTIKLRAFGRMIEILIYMLGVSILVSFISSVGDTDLSNLLPIMANGPMPVFDAMIKHCFWFGDFMLFYFLLGDIKISKHTGRSIMVGWATGCLIVLGISAIFYGIFNLTSSMHIEAIVEIAEYFPKLSTETRFNWIIAFIFPFALFYSVCLYTKLSYNSFQYAFNAKEKHKYYIILFVIILIIAILLVTEITFEILKEFLTGWFNFVIVFIQYGIPLLIPIAYVIYKNKKQREKTV